jgi:hypothetical protein
MPTTPLQTSPRNVPLPAQAVRLHVAALVVDNGRWATQWKYTVPDADPASIVSLYKNSMPTNSWTLVFTSETGPNGGQLLKYTRDYRICYLEIIKSSQIPGNTTIFITITN